VTRALILVLAAGLGLAGCSRSADPLDWKIQAGDPAELENWFAKNVLLMPPELGDEVIVSFNNIKANTPPVPHAGPSNREYNICRHIDGHTVRELVIEGHELANRQAMMTIARQSDMVLRMLADADTLGPEELKQREALMNTQLALQARLQQTLKNGEARLAALRSQTGPK
jgi:hypothetical protein